MDARQYFLHPDPGTGSRALDVLHHDHHNDRSIPKRRHHLPHPHPYPRTQAPNTTGPLDILHQHYYYYYHDTRKFNRERRSKYECKVFQIT